MKKTLVYAASALLLMSLLVSCNPQTQSTSTSAAPATTLTKKNIHLYAQTTANVVPYDIYFDSDYPDIPFVDLATLTDFLSAIKASESSVVTYAMDGTKGTFTTSDGDTAIFDFSAKTLTFPSQERFFAKANISNSGLDPLGIFPTDSDGVTPLLIKRTKAIAVTGHETVVDFGAHHVPMIYENGAGYIPLQSFSDLFANEALTSVLYNGKDAFYFTSSMASDMEDLYYSVPTGSRSKSLAEFTYNELCLNADNVYGLKEKHSITNFDDFFTRSGRKADLLSLDPKVADTALAYATLFDLDDNHSSMRMPSYLSGKNLNLRDKKFFGTSQAAWESNYSRFSEARKEKLGATILPYQEIGDTAFVSFDTFAVSDKDYYSAEPTEEDAANDTFACVQFAQKKITRENSPVKKVVLDLSCNSGGAASTAAYVCSWFLNGATFHLKNPLDKATLDLSFIADTNLDKVYDEKDSIQDKKLYCLTSPLSFSCGNLVPSVLKTAGTVTIIGQKSGGGACGVDFTSTADGTRFAFSGKSELCTVKNGAYYDVDQGVDPDFSISDPADFYNRPALALYLDTLK